MSNQTDPKEAVPSDRSTRREEIKLLLEYIKLAFSVFGVATLILAVLQWRASNMAATEMAYQRIATEWRDQLKALVDKPDLRPYFEERKQLAVNDPNRNVVLALADVRLDTVDAILTYVALHKASDEIVGWKSTFANAFKTSPTLCTRLKETRNNYGLIVPIADEVCPK